MDSVIKFICMLEIISFAPKDGLSTNEIRQKLEDKGISILPRSLQRDLVTLKTYYPLVCNDKVRPHRWHFAPDYKGSFAPMDVSSAIGTILVNEYLLNAIPAPLLSQLSPQLSRAQSFIRSNSDASYANWLDKVKIVPNGMVLEPAVIDQDTWAMVCEAIMTNTALDVLYESRSKDKVHSFTLHPYGLMIRQSATYVLGAYDDYDDVRQYALHRCVSMSLSSTAFRPAPDFSIKQYVESGAAGLKFSDEDIHLGAYISKDLSKRLRETKLSDRQIILETESDQWYFIRAVVPDSRDMRAWLLSLGAEIIVKEPKSLRESLLKEIASINEQSNSLSGLKIKSD